MDKENTSVRKYLCQRAELIGAIRLPDNTFKSNAGTEVTSDIIFLKKRDKITDIEESWVNLDTTENGIKMNKYFVDNPNMIMGQMVMESTRFGESSACKMIDGSDLDYMLSNAISKAKAQSLVDEGIENSKNGIMNLERFVPWQEYIFSSVNPKAKEILFVVFPSNRGGFNCQCVPDFLGGFGQRNPLPETWRGLNGEQLRKASGVESAIFCHPAGFMCSAGTREDAIKMAEIAMAR